MRVRSEQLACGIMGKSNFDDGMMRCVGLGISNICEGGMMGGMMDFDTGPRATGVWH